MKRITLIHIVITTLLGISIGCVSYAKTDTVNIPLLAKLTNAHAASGFEGPVRNILRAQWSRILSNLKTDGMGNLYGELDGSTAAPKVLLMAHMDEVGLIVRDISKNGFIHFISLGGWLNPMLTGQRWIITTPKGLVEGYTGMESGHIISSYPKIKRISKDNMFIDIGADNRQQAMNQFAIRPGLPITPDAKFVVLKNQHRYMAKAFDDRAALAVITQGIQDIHTSNQHPNKLYVASKCTRRNWVEGRGGTL